MKTKLVFLALMLASCFAINAGNVLRWSDGSLVAGEVNSPIRTVERVGDCIEVTYEFGEFGIEANASNASYILSMPSFTACTESGEPSYLFKMDYLNVDAKNGSQQIQVASPGTYAVSLVINGEICVTKKSSYNETDA